MILSITHQLCVLSVLLPSVLSEPVYRVCINRTKPLLTDEQRLLMTLMDGYSSATRPVINASKAVNVYIGITLTQIFDIDERNQVMTTNIWLDQEWDDEKLRWNPDDYGGLTKLRIPCRKLWLPDIVLYNSADDYTDGYMSARAMVTNNGTVFWPPIVKLRSTCQIDISYFPFDDQVCRMKLGSWAYDGFQLDLFKRSDNIDLSNYVQNGEWELMNVETELAVLHFNENTSMLEAVNPYCTPQIKISYLKVKNGEHSMETVKVPCTIHMDEACITFWCRLLMDNVLGWQRRLMMKEGSVFCI